MPKISKNIKKFRAENNMTQDDLAEKMHITRQAISNWENDKTKPDIEALQSLAEVFQVEIEELIYGQKKEVIMSTDKTKEKKRIKIILAIIGSAFVALGISLVFFGFWQDFPITLKTACSLVPMLLGQGFAIYTFLKKKDNLLWRESASIVWTIGVISSIALIDYIYDISWTYTDYLIIDSFLIIPIMFIFSAVAPLAFCYYMSLHIVATSTWQGILFSMLFFAVGVLFSHFVLKDKDDGRNKYAQWVTVIASIPLLVMYMTAGDYLNFLSVEMSTIFAMLLAYFLCMDIATPEKSPFSLPYKPISLLGTCITMLGLSLGLIMDTPTIQGELIPFIITMLICLGAPIITFIVKRENFKGNISRVITTILPFGVIILTFIAAAYDEYSTTWIENSVLIILGIALAIAFGAMIVYQGVKKVHLLTVNIGVLTVFVEIIGLFVRMDADILVLGILLVLFGVGLIAINRKMLSIKKSLIEQGGGTDE